MRTLTLQNLTTAGSAILACPAGKRIRLVSLISGVNGIIKGDAVTLTILRSNNEVGFASTEPLPATAAGVHFGIGLQAMSPMIDDQTVATGVINYNAVATDFTAPLPDVWWPWEVTLSLSAPGGAANFTNGSLALETADAD